MFLRESKQKRAGGAVVTHLQFAESVWNKAAQHADTQIVYNFGRADDPAVRERLRTLARSILRRVAPEEILAIYRKFLAEISRLVIAIDTLRVP